MQHCIRSCSNNAGQQKLFEYRNILARQAISQKMYLPLLVNVALLPLAFFRK